MEVESLPNPMWINFEGGISPDDAERRSDLFLTPARFFFGWKVTLVENVPSKYEQTAKLVERIALGILVIPLIVAVISAIIGAVILRDSATHNLKYAAFKAELEKPKLQNLDDLYAKGDWSLAINGYNSLIDAEPENLSRYGFRGICHFYLENYEYAKSDLDKCLESGSTELEVWLIRSEIAREEDDLVKARSLCEHAQIHCVKDDEDRVGCFVELGRVALQEGNTGEAEALLTQALTMDSDNVESKDFGADIYVAIARDFYNKREVGQARAALQKAKAYNPQHRDLQEVEKALNVPRRLFDAGEKGEE